MAYYNYNRYNRQGAGPVSGQASLADALADVMGRRQGVRRAKKEEKRQDKRALLNYARTSVVGNKLQRLNQEKLFEQGLLQQDKVFQKELTNQPLKTKAEIENKRTLLKAYGEDVEAGLYPEVVKGREKMNLDIDLAEENLERMQMLNDPNSWLSKSDETERQLRNDLLKKQIENAKEQHLLIQKKLMQGQSLNPDILKNYTDILQKSADSYEYFATQLDDKAIKKAFGEDVTSKDLMNRWRKIKNQIEKINNQAMGLNFEEEESGQYQDQYQDQGGTPLMDAMTGATDSGHGQIISTDDGRRWIIEKDPKTKQDVYVEIE